MRPLLVMNRLDRAVACDALPPIWWRHYFVLHPQCISVSCLVFIFYLWTGISTKLTQRTRHHMYQFGWGHIRRHGFILHCLSISAYQNYLHPIREYLHHISYLCQVDVFFFSFIKTLYLKYLYICTPTPKSSWTLAHPNNSVMKIWNFRILFYCK